jgi:hypothetical protein
VLEDRAAGGARGDEQVGGTGGGLQRRPHVRVDVGADREGGEDRRDAEGDAQDRRERSPAVAQQVAQRESGEQGHA